MKNQQQNNYDPIGGIGYFDKTRAETWFSEGGTNLCNEDSNWASTVWWFSLVNVSLSLSILVNMSLIQFYKRANQCDNFVQCDWHLERRGEVGELGRTEEGGGGEGETPLGRQKYETEEMGTFFYRHTGCCCVRTCLVATLCFNFLVMLVQNIS